MKIFILIPELHGGGAEIVVSTWAHVLASLNHEVKVVLTHGHKPTTPDLPFEVERLDRSSKFSHTSAFRSLRRMLREGQPDILLTAMPYANLLGIFAAIGLNAAVVISEHAIHTGMVESSSWSEKVQWWLARRFYKWADACIACSHPLAAELAAVCGLERKQLWVVPNPVVLAAEGSECLGDAEVPDIRLVSPGRLVWNKRPKLVVEAAQLLRDRYNMRVVVDFFGTGIEQSAVERYAEKLGVECGFHGWVSDWWQKVGPGSIVLLTSQMEGLSNVLIESAAANIPCVASSKALGVADACIPGVTGILVSGDSAVSYAQGVLDARNLAPFSVQGWLAQFSQQKIGQTLQEVMFSTVPRNDSGGEYGHTRR